MVKDLISNTLRNIKKNKIRSLNDVYKVNINLVNFSIKFTEIINEIRYFLRINMYNNNSVLKKIIKEKK